AGDYTAAVSVPGAAGCRVQATAAAIDPSWVSIGQGQAVVGVAIFKSTSAVAAASASVTQLVAEVLSSAATSPIGEARLTQLVAEILTAQAPAALRGRPAP